MNYYFLNSKIEDIDNSVICISCAIQLKIIFLAVKEKYNKFTLNQIATILNKNENEIEEAIDFWVNLGVIGISSRTVNSEEILEKINRDYTSKRIKLGKNIDIFLDKVENILGRTLSGEDVSLFMKLRDVEGMSSKLIYMLIKYCVKLGKNSTRYIESVSKSWIDQKINTVEDAKEKIRIDNKVEYFWNKFQKLIGINKRIPTVREKEAIERWFIKWNYEIQIIKEAYERCVNSKGEYNLSYMDGILKRWKNQGISDVDDIKSNRNYGNLKYVSTYDTKKYEKFGIINLET